MVFDQPASKFIAVCDKANLFLHFLKSFFIESFLKRLNIQKKLQVSFGLLCSKLVSCADEITCFNTNNPVY